MFEIPGRFFPKKNIVVDKIDKTFDSAFGDSRWAAAAARADPLISTNSFYLGPASETFRAMKYLRKHASDLTLTLYIMHSKTDTRTDVNVARSFFASAGSVDKEITVYDDASHLLFQHKIENVQRAINDMISWFDKRFWSLLNLATIRIKFSQV